VHVISKENSNEATSNRAAVYGINYGIPIKADQQIVLGQESGFFIYNSLNAWMLTLKVETDNNFETCSIIPPEALRTGIHNTSKLSNLLRYRSAPTVV
jgi:hypothetical protein